MPLSPKEQADMDAGKYTAPKPDPNAPPAIQKATNNSSEVLAKLKELGKI